MRRRVPLIIGSTALVGLLLGLGAGSAAQTVEGLDLAKVRARAKLSPQDAEALAVFFCPAKHVTLKQHQNLQMKSRALPIHPAEAP